MRGYAYITKVFLTENEFEYTFGHCVLHHCSETERVSQFQQYYSARLLVDLLLLRSSDEYYVRFTAPVCPVVTSVVWCPT